MHSLAEEGNQAKQDKRRPHNFLSSSSMRTSDLSLSWGQAALPGHAVWKWLRAGQPPHRRAMDQAAPAPQMAQLETETLKALQKGHSRRTSGESWPC